MATKRQKAQAILEDMGCNPIEALARIAMKAERDHEFVLAKDCYKDLAGFAYPKLKAVEVSVDPESGPLFAINGVSLPSEAIRADTEANAST